MKKKLIAWLCATSLLVCGTAAPSAAHAAKKPVSLLSNRVHIPDNVTSIDYGAFKDCSNLTSIKIPDNIIMIGIGDDENCGYSAFYGIPQIIYDGSNCTNYSEWGADKVIRSDGTILYSRNKGNNDDE